ncbi:MAG TPA: hypothetical protein DEP28_12315 [Bacteroidetes bacterium]|nr:hypothetical protein [Bacteroidota bacterium]
MSKIGHIDIPATEITIKQLNDYSKQLDDFKKYLDSEVDSLGQVHLDQNFKKFYDYFQKFWPEIVVFKKEIDKFNEFLWAKKEFINEEYAKLGIKLPH